MILCTKNCDVFDRKRLADSKEICFCPECENVRQITVKRTIPSSRHSRINDSSIWPRQISFSRNVLESWKLSITNYGSDLVGEDCIFVVQIWIAWFITLLLCCDCEQGSTHVRVRLGSMHWKRHIFVFSVFLHIGMVLGKAGVRRRISNSNIKTSLFNTIIVAKCFIFRCF